MNKLEIQSTLNAIGDLMGDIRSADRAKNDRVTELQTQIVGKLKTLAEAKVPIATVKRQLMEWNTNTQDGIKIRSNAAINLWLRKAGFRSRAKRNDSGTVKSDKNKVIAFIRALMEKHGITVADLS